MLYEGAIRFLECALSGFQYEDPKEFNETINNNIIRGQDIIRELDSSLDLAQGGDLATTLRSARCLERNAGSAGRRAEGV